MSRKPRLIKPLPEERQHYRWRYRKAKEWERKWPGEAKAHNVYFTDDLAGPDGAAFTLFREADHTDKDIEKACRYLRVSRDVVAIYIVLLKDLL